MELPGVFSVQLTQPGGGPLAEPNIVLQIEFYEEGSARYVFVAGATDPEGHIDISVPGLRQQLARGQLMDPDTFDTDLESCDSVISLFVPPPEFTEEMTRQFRGASSTPENAAALWMYRNATNYKVRSIRMGYNLAEVPPLERLRLVLEVQPVLTEGGHQLS